MIENLCQEVEGGVGQLPGRVGFVRGHRAAGHLHHAPPEREKTCEL